LVQKKGFQFLCKTDDRFEAGPVGESLVKVRQISLFLLTLDMFLSTAEWTKACSKSENNLCSNVILLTLRRFLPTGNRLVLLKADSLADGEDDFSSQI